MSDPHEHEHELVDADDAVIGATFRRHLRIVLAVLLLAALAVGGLVVARSLRPPPPEQTFESVAPVAPPASSSRSLAPPALPFADVAAQAGVDFVHTNGARGDKLLPESMGSGAAFFDADGDGDPDLLLLDGRAWPGDPPVADAGAGSGTRFYRNTSEGGAVRFEDVTAGSGFDRLADLYATGVAIGDVDGDGRRDVFVAAVGGNRLLRNLGPSAPGGPARFEDVTDRAGVGGADDAWSTSSVFFDYDNDGDLDLFVGNYVRWSREIDFEVDYRLTGVGRAYGPPVNYQGTFSYLYRNDGPGANGVARFVDVSAESGIEITNEATGVPVGKALGVVALDADGDGWSDLMVANDTVRNFLFHNRGAEAAGGGARFDEVGELWGLAYDRDGAATGAMGIDAGHLRDDGALGFAIGNFANEMTSLYIAQGDPTLYADEAIGEGVGAPSRTLLSFGLLFLDVDLDGRLDILQTNGHLETEIGKVDPSQTYEQPSQLFWNAGPAARATFIALEPDDLGDLGQPIVGRGSAVADIDGDGDLDLVLTQTGRRALLLRNDQALGHHWLRVRLRQDGMNPDAIGAWVELVTPAGRQRRPVMPGRSYQSYSEPVITFGLGDEASVESLEVTWPDGQVQTVPVAAIDRLLVVERE